MILILKLITVGLVNVIDFVSRKSFSQGWLIKGKGVHDSRSISWLKRISEWSKSECLVRSIDKYLEVHGSFL